MSTHPIEFDLVRLEHTAVTVVLPCLNEATSVGACVEEALAAIEAAGYHGEVVVVDNNSTDDSAAAAVAAGATVVREPVQGYGAALRAGFAAARGDIIVMADCDGTYSLSRLSELVDPVTLHQADLVIGARLDGATSASMPFLHRYLGTPTLTALVRLAGAQTGLTDSQSGFRAFRRGDLDRLALNSTGMELASEMLIRAGQCDLLIEEVALGYGQRAGESKLRTWSDGMRHLRLIMRMGPHVALWYPGLALLTVSVLLLLASVFFPDGLAIGEVLWQPVFAASILAVVGVCAATAGGLLGAFGPDASPQVRQKFAWVRDHRTPRRLNRGALGAITLGIAVDTALFVRWAEHQESLGAQLQIATVAQVAVVVGTIVLMVGVLLGLFNRRAVAR